MDITKILLSIIVAIMIVTTTNATTMCVTDDNNFIILDPNIEGTNNSRNEVMKTWTTTFSYGTVSGIATCNNTMGTTNTAYPQYNFDDNHASITGRYCWCKMTSPVRSAWVYISEDSLESECTSNCANRCGYRLNHQTNIRTSMFNSAGM